jgi:dihydrofolate reductase
MRIVVNEFISLDGVVQAPGGAEEDTDGGFTHGGWSMPYFSPDEMGPSLGQMLDRATALLYGRRTWRVMADHWPDRAGDPFADWLNTAPKYVASRTLTAADMTWPGSSLLPADDAIGAIRALRDAEDGELFVMGSTSLVRELLANDLIDELNLLIEPIILGGGKRIFSDDGIARRLKLASAQTTSTGVQICTYLRADAER